MDYSDFRKLERELSHKRNAGSSILLLTIVTLVVIIMTWATITEIDSVVRGSGETSSSASNQLVQSSEPGVIRSRYVNEGDVVTKGQILFDIDPIDAKAQLDQANKRLNSLSIKAIRLQAEVNGVLPDFPKDLLEVEPIAISTELSLYKARLDDLTTKAAILDQRRSQKITEIEELKIQQNTAENNLVLLRKEISTIEPLVKSGLAPETRLIALKREEESSLGAVNSSLAGQNRLASGLLEIDEQLKSEQQKYVTVSLTELSSIEAELQELKARLPSLQSRLDRNTIKSPVDGVVNRLNYMTADAYIGVGDVLLEIVPSGSDIIVEAKIDPKDIAEIQLGMLVKVSLTAYDPSKYGRIDGRVKNISADAITDPQTGMQFYSVDVALDSQLYEDDGRAVTILPGMVASIDVLSGKRTVLDYFWQPIAKTKDKALRD